MALHSLTMQPERDVLWFHRRVSPVRFEDRLMLFALVAAGIAAVLRLADWWFRAEHIGDPTLYILLSLAFWYGISRIVVGWFNIIGIAIPAEKPAPEGLSVAIFTTSSPGEPLSMFERTLEACARIRYPHTTYLLDDTRDPRYRELAERCGAVWLGLVGIPGAKAGKINTALSMTKEEYILVLDPDHVPFPNILDRVLGYFDDRRIGFVQISQAYYNQFRSFTARAAAEQTYMFYGPILMGLFGHGASLAIGANCTFRRRALESIGGHGIGLAEDLVTATRLHAAGWRSIYIPEILSRGLVPEDLGSFFQQQLKWSRGVYEVLFAELPGLFQKLTWRQRIAYLTIGTYYLCGLTTFIYLFIPYLYLWMGLQPASMPFEEFLTSVGPVGLLGLVIYRFGQRWLCHPERERGLHWRGLMLKIGCWPVYCVGTISAIVRKSIPYLPTSKEARSGKFVRLAWPHLLLVVFFIVTLIRVMAMRLTTTPEGSLMLTTEAVWGMVGFASMSVLMISGVVYAAWEARRPPRGFAWDDIERSQLEGL